MWEIGWTQKRMVGLDFFLPTVQMWLCMDHAGKTPYLWTTSKCYLA